MNKRGITVVEILVVIVILAVVGLVIMMSVIPRIEQNAKDNFIEDVKLYLQASAKEVTDDKIDGKEFTSKCLSIAELNKTKIGVVDKKNYSGYVTITLNATDKSVAYNIAITNGRFYSYNRISDSYLISGDKIEDDSFLDNFDDTKNFPTKCPSE